MKVEEEKRRGPEEGGDDFFFLTKDSGEGRPLPPPARWCVLSVRFASVHPQMQIRFLSQYKEPLQGLVRPKIEHSNPLQRFPVRIPPVWTFQEICQCCGSSRRSSAETHEQKNKPKKTPESQQRSLAWNCGFNAMFSGAKRSSVAAKAVLACSPRWPAPHRSCRDVNLALVEEAARGADF